MRVGKTKKPHLSWHLSGLYNIELISKVQTAWSQLWQPWESCSRAVVCLFHSPQSELRISEGNRVQDVSCSKKVVLLPLLQPFAWGECIKKKKNAQGFLICNLHHRRQRKKTKNTGLSLKNEAEVGQILGVPRRETTHWFYREVRRGSTFHLLELKTPSVAASDSCFLPLTCGDTTRYQSPI